MKIPTVGNGNYPVLGGQVQVDCLAVASASLTLGTHTLTAFDVSVNGATISSSNGGISAVSISRWEDTNAFGKISVETEYGVINGGNTFNGDLSLNAKKCTHCATYQWPMAYLYVSYAKGDTFKGVTDITGSGTNIQLGYGSTTTTFEKKATVSINNGTTGATRLLFSKRGGRVVFKDSTFLNFKSLETESGIGSPSGLIFSSFIDFEKPVLISIDGGDSTSDQWSDYTPPSSGQAKGSVTNFYGNLSLNIVRGFLSLGKGHQANQVKNRAVFDSTAQLSVLPAQFTTGILQLINVTFNSPLGTDIVCSTYPTLYNAETSVNFSGVLSKGPMNVRADNITIATSIFEGRSKFERNGADYANRGDSRYAYSPGGNTFHQPVRLSSTAGYDWLHAPEMPDVCKDSLILYFDGKGERLRPTGQREGFLKIGMTGGSRAEGPIVASTGPDADGDFYFGKASAATTLEIQSSVNLQNALLSSVCFESCLFKGSTARSMLLGGNTKKIKFSGTGLVEGQIQVQAPHLEVSGTTFLQPSTFIKSGAGDDSSVGGNTFHGRVRFINTLGSGKLHFLSGEDKVIK